MTRLLGCLCVAGLLMAAPHRSATAQATTADSVKNRAANKGRKAEARAEKKEERKEGAKEAKEPHPHIRAAIRELEASKRELESAAHDFGGHRVEAIKAIDEAIKQLRLAQAADRK